MWGRRRGACSAIKLLSLIQRGADIKAQSALVERGRGPALGKSNDTRRAVAAQGQAALAAGTAIQVVQIWPGCAIRMGPERRRRMLVEARLRQVGREAGLALPVRELEQPAAAAGGDGQNPDDGGGAAIGFGGGGRRGQGAVLDGGALTPLVYAVRSNDLDSVKVLLEAGADINPWSYRLRLEPAACRYAESLLQARRLPARARRGRQSGQQRRLDAAVSGHRQPQHRIRRLSGPQGRHGSPGLHQAAAGQGSERERADEGQHRGLSRFSPTNGWMKTARRRSCAPLNPATSL